VHRELLEGNAEKREIKMEFYKLDVYGSPSSRKGSFYTPRSDTMIGSLVIVFPTPHDGGEVVLRKNDHEWVGDFNCQIKIKRLLASMSESSQQPCVGYVSFFSGVEHEVHVVTSGHRVTLTYNSYFSQGDRCTSSYPVHIITDQTLAEAAHELTTNNRLLPSGGYLGIGLCRQNPV
ncbi:hypothetical protein F5J12DRAFT_701038, partial [Pisolithus orientalis]|uniref:uncharacterized protein n=1 Tax=Pisolithus orientalis TaxID=936130 RepID=UPI00222582E8